MKIYLERLKRWDPVLHCVVNLTEKLALDQADKADREIGAGRYRGFLHGIPWGAKDLLAYPGYPTTWGAPQFKDRILSERATVARRLDEAGAVLLAKLSLGALAEGDRWFGGMTRNPWNPEQGSSGSSAGSASAVVAGLVAFAIGSETLGSIVSPCRRCGSVGLRPTFGRVSRFGCMTLSWTMDKIGPLARSVEDCAIVLSVIHGHDPDDATTVTRRFDWPFQGDIRQLRVGYFEDAPGRTDERVTKTLRDIGVKLVPVKLPTTPSARSLMLVLNAESAAAFDEWTRKGIVEGLNNWPGRFREGQFIPAVEYLRANRLRTLLIEQMQALMSKIDLYVGGDDLAITNLTGHPTIVLPGEYVQVEGRIQPRSITFTGRLFGESGLLAVAHAYQTAVGDRGHRPTLERALDNSKRTPPKSTQ